MILSEKNKEALSSLFLGLFAVVLATFLITGIRWFGSRGDKTNEQEQADRIEQKVEEIAKTLTPFEYKEKMLKSKIITDFTNSTKSYQPSDTFEKKISVQGKLKRGFLYVKASVNDQKLTQYDDVYVKVMGTIRGQHTELGGHLIEKKTLETPKSDYFTELLFDLTDVKYNESFKDPDYKVVSGDWLELLNSGDSQVILSFVSTQRQGKIIDLSIYYECESEICLVQ